MDEPGSAFATGEELGEPEIGEPDLSFDIDLEAPDLEVPVLGGEPEASAEEMVLEGELVLEEDDERVTEAVDPEVVKAVVDEEPAFELELEEPEEIVWGFEEQQADAAADSTTDAALPIDPIEVEPIEFEAPEPEPGALEGEEEARPQDLLAEAEVFSKYGLEGKARERLAQILDGDPETTGALALLLELEIKAKDASAVESVAKRLEAAAAARGDEELWERSRATIEEAGFAVPGAEAQVEKPKKAKKKDRVSMLLESLMDEVPGVRRKKRKRAKKPVEEVAPVLAPVEIEEPVAVDEPVALVDEAAPPPAAEAVESVEEPVAPVAAAEADDGGLPYVAPGDDDLDEFDDELPGIVLPEEMAPPVMDDSGMDWLKDEPVAAPAGGGGSKLFDDEDEFFDLAAELEEELGAEERQLADDIITQPEEPSLEEIVEGFKKGVAENLSEEDYATHYNLGIAYREMGLVDEAIGEFQLAAKDPGHLVECCSMLGVCFQEKGLPELAIKWYQRGLAAPEISDDTVASLLYDMGDAYVMAGDNEAARKTYVELYGINSNYRDIAAKLEGLEAKS